MNYVGLTEAIIASSNRKYIVSEPDADGVRHMIHPRLLNAKRLSVTSAVCNSGVLPTNPHKLRWEIRD